MATVVYDEEPRPSSGDAAARDLERSRASSKLLGGPRFARRELRTRSDIHQALLGGVPYASLLYFIANLKVLTEDDLVAVLGISARTLRRHRDTPKKPMPADLASRAWLFAETLARACDVFGGQEEAERWMSAPAIGLDGQRPVNLLRTLQGAELVNDFLGRLEYGVYS